MTPHPLTNFEIQIHYQNESKFNRNSSRNNLPNINNGTYEINLMSTNQCNLIDLMFMLKMLQQHSFGAEKILKEIKKFTGNKIIQANIYRIQAYDLIVRKYCCIGFIEFMLNNERLAEVISVFFPSNFFQK